MDIFNKYGQRKRKEMKRPFLVFPKSQTYIIILLYPPHFLAPLPPKSYITSSINNKHDITCCDFENQNQ